MKKKVLYGAALALFASVSMGTLQSCKDDLSDLEHKIAFDQTNLKGEITRLEGLISQCQSHCASEIARLEGLLAGYVKTGDFESFKTTLAAWQQTVATKSELTTLEGKLNTLEGKLDLYALKSDLNGFLTAADLNGYLKEGDLEGYLKASDLEGYVKAEDLEGFLKEADLDEYAKKEFVTNLTNALGNRITTEVGAVVSRLNDEIVPAIQGLQGDVATLTTNLSTVSANLATVTGDLATLNGEFTQYKADQLLVIQGIQDDLDAKQTAIETLQTGLSDLGTTVENLGTTVEEHTTYITELQTNYTELQTKYGELETNLNTVTSDLANLDKKLFGEEGVVPQIQNELQELNTLYNALSGRIDKLITGILIQGVDGPVFGNFSLPIGVKNNLLFNWYGYNETNILEFPTNKKQFTPSKEKDLDIKFDKSAVIDINDGYLGDVNLGRLYLTINPAGHVFNNKFTLETTAGKPLPFDFEVTKSNDELYFGYTRSTVEGNGFYAADVKISGDNMAAGINAVSLKVDENLKSAVKEVLNDRSKRSALNLLKAVYGTISNQLPAYAVRYNWDGGKYSVASQYDLALATAKPLSYEFFYDKSIDHKLRTFGHIDNFILELKKQGKLHFKFDPITFDDINISLPEIKITTDDVTPGDTKISVTVEPIIVYDAAGNEIGRSEEQTFYAENANTIIDDLAGQINTTIKSITSQIKDWSETANNDLTNQVKDALSPVADQINKMMDSINGQIDEKLEDIGNQFQPWFNRLNRVVDLYNKVANKINDILDDPNHLLQVAMFYQGGRAGINIVSNSKSDPTVFNSGKGYVGLYASSYSAELVAPAFKKYVAVTNVYKKVKENGKTVVKEADNADALVAKANSSDRFNQVMDGCTIRYSIPTENLQTGLIYEIVYQGLDFHGVTSTQKFYITVK